MKHIWTPGSLTRLGMKIQPDNLWAATQVVLGKTVVLQVSLWVCRLMVWVILTRPRYLDVCQLPASWLWRYFVSNVSIRFSRHRVYFPVMWWASSSHLRALGEKVLLGGVLCCLWMPTAAAALPGLQSVHPCGIQPCCSIMTQASALQSVSTHMHVRVHLWCMQTSTYVLLILHLFLQQGSPGNLARVMKEWRKNRHAFRKSGIG